MNTTPFDPKAVTKALLREARSAALATLMPGSSDPYVSLVNVATAPSGAPVILISRLAVHTKNLLADGRASLLIEQRTDDDPLASPRVSLTGTMTSTDDAHGRRRYLARHPDAEAFAGFTDFAFYEMRLSSAHLVAGFGRIVDLTAADILTDLFGADDLIAAEAGAVAHMDADHPDALRLYATALLGGPDGAWRCAGCDPDGLDLQCGRRALRLPFPHRVTTANELRQVLKAFAEQARRA